jgi:lipopolysaccharide transport system ATP-binding protein
MSRAEVKRKFDEIVDFAGVERYIDTPVKRYSSGMYVRLAFAVAAHLEQDILIVDEVLAVGDVEFQKKCLGKMKDVSVNDGRTVLFVSHNMAAVSNLCNRSVLLHNGNVSIDGVTSDVIPSYLKNYRLKLNQELLSRQDRTGIGEIRFSKVSFNVLNHSKVNTLISGADCSLRLHFISIDNLRLFKNCRISVSIANSDSNLILLSTDLVTDKSINITANSIVEFRIKKMPLSKGSYYLTLFLESNHSVQDWIEDAFTLEVEDGDFFGNGRNYPSGWEGKTVLIQHEVKII